MKNTALITGASGGIGRELAIIHAGHGGDLVIVARSGDILDDLAQELRGAYGVSIEVLEKDLTRPEAPGEIQSFTHEKNIQVEYLINNAGFGDYGPFAETDWTKESSMIDVNIKALTELTKRFLPEMKARGGGGIMNVASLAAFQPGPLMAVYYATKSYVLSFSEAIAQELEGTGVSVTTLCPGPTKTDFQARSGMEGSRLIDSASLPGAREIAEYGYTKMMSGTRVAIPGFRNKLLAFAVRFVPRRTLTKAVLKMQEAS